MQLLPLDVFYMLTPFLDDAEAACLLLTEKKIQRYFRWELRVLTRLQRLSGCLGSCLKYRKVTYLFSRVAAVREIQMWWRRRGLLEWVRAAVEDARSLSQGPVQTNFGSSLTVELERLSPSCPSCFAGQIALAMCYPATEFSWHLFIDCRDCFQRRTDAMMRFMWGCLYLADLDRGPYRLTSVWDLLD